MLRTVHRLALACLVFATIIPAVAAQAPVKQDQAALLETGLTINDCLQILTGLSKLDEPHEVIVNKGKSGEAITKEYYEYAQSGIQLDISHNIALLGAMQREAQVPQQRALYRLLRTLPPTPGAKLGDPPIPAKELPAGSQQAEDYDTEMRQLAEKPCRVQLTRLKASDLLNEGKNKIQINVFALIDKILDR